MPLIFFLSFFLLLIPTYSTATYTLVLDPNGDARRPGRIIGESFERGLTFQCAAELQKGLASRCPWARIVLTRVPGETVEPLQNAQFANKLGTDLFITISFYERPEGACIDLYHYASELTDSWNKPTQSLAFVPYDQAHRPHLHTCHTYAQKLRTLLQGHAEGKKYTIRGPHAFPFGPLVGINCPALAIEIGLTTENEWKKITAILLELLAQVIAERIHV